MKIAPIIHSRTLKSDFNSNFAVRPKDLNVDWAMSKILPSTRDIDILDGVRRVVANDGKICIAGIACNFKMFAEKFLSAEERDDAKKYFCDERGREIKVFLGYAFKDSGTPDVSASKLWKMFEKYFAPQWELEAPETKFAGYDEECATKSVGKKSFDKKFYSSNEHADIELFEQCLAQRKDFCSNVDSVKIFEDGKYKIITALPSVINRLQAEAQKKTQPSTTRKEQSNQPTRQTFQANRQNRRISASTEKKGSSMPIIIGIILLAIILTAIAFFVMNPQSEEKEERHSQTSMNCSTNLNAITKVRKSANVSTTNIASQPLIAKQDFSFGKSLKAF